jgi:hypothetical protein
MAGIFRFAWALFLIKLSTLTVLAEPEVKFSRPAGSDILPGAAIADTDIKSSYAFSKLLPFLIRYALQLAIAAAVIAMIIGGYQILTAYGDTEKNTTGKNTVIYAAIGLVIAMTAYGIVAIITSVQLTAPE